MGCCCVNPLEVDENIQENLTDSRALISKNKQALILKEQGNEHFKKKAYENAIRCYHQALIKNPNELVYYTNLALAYKAAGQFEQAIKTIQQMEKGRVRLTPNSSDLLCKGNVIKARCINSIAKRYIVNSIYTPQQSQRMLEKIQVAIKSLQQTKESSTIVVDEYLNNSLKIKLYLQKIKKKTSESEVIDFLKKKMKQSKRGLHNQKNWQKIKDFIPNEKALLKQLTECYQKLHAKFIEQAEEDEQYLLDPITYVFFYDKKQKYRDPVIVPSGITYEQTTLRQYFKKGEQYKDPITKEKFQVGQKVIVRNQALKNYISEMGKIHEIKKEDIQLLVC